MKYAKFLPEGGTIGFIAPSFGCNIEPYHTAFGHAQKTWESLGYNLKCGPNAYEGSGLGISNTPEKCAEEFNEWYRSDETDILISCGGGELMCDILDFVDFEGVKAGRPKWFMGYSDNTNLTFLLSTICDTAAIYGPCAPAFGMEPWHDSLKDAMKLLKGESHRAHGYELWERESLKTEEDPLQPYNCTEPRVLKIYSGQDNQKTHKNHIVGSDLGNENITFSGRLLGGCLDSLITLCGTKFDQVESFNQRYEKDGVVWFLEACDLNPMSIRRAMWQLAHAGWFGCVRGFLIGRPLCYGEDFMGLDQYKAVTDILGQFNVPIIMDVDLGHLPPMMPLVCGSLGHVKVEGNDIEVEMEYI